MDGAPGRFGLGGESNCKSKSHDNYGDSGCASDCLDCQAKSGLWKRRKTVERVFRLSHNPDDDYEMRDWKTGFGAVWMRWRISLALALRRTSSLWARAMRTTLGGLPAPASRSRKAMKSGS